MGERKDVEEKKDVEKYLQEKGRLFGSGSAWVTYCVIFVILPTLLKYCICSEPR